MAKPKDRSSAFQRFGPVQFRLRTLMLVITIVATVMGYVINERKKVSDWLEAIKKRGGIALCLSLKDPLETRDPDLLDAMPTRQRWAQAIFGELWVDGVYLVYLTGPTIFDEDLQLLVRARNMQVLDLRGAKITDDGLKLVAQFSQLRRLELSETTITDSGLKFLENMPALEVLDLSGTQVTDAGVQSLQKMKHLIILEVRGTPMAKGQLFQEWNAKSGVCRQELRD